MADIIPIDGRGGRSHTQTAADDAAITIDEADVLALFRSIKDQAVREAVFELLKSVADREA